MFIFIHFSIFSLCKLPVSGDDVRIVVWSSEKRFVCFSVTAEVEAVFPSVSLATVIEVRVEIVGVTYLREMAVVVTMVLVVGRAGTLMVVAEVSNVLRLVVLPLVDVDDDLRWYLVVLGREADDLMSFNVDDNISSVRIIIIMLQ